MVGADIDNIDPSTGMTLLHYACQARQHAAVKWCLDKQMDPNATGVLNNHCLSKEYMFFS